MSAPTPQDQTTIITPQESAARQHLRQQIGNNGNAQAVIDVVDEIQPFIIENLTVNIDANVLGVAIATALIESGRVGNRTNGFTGFRNDRPQLLWALGAGLIAFLVMAAIFLLGTDVAVVLSLIVSGIVSAVVMLIATPFVPERVIGEDR